MEKMRARVPVKLMIFLQLFIFMAVFAFSAEAASEREINIPQKRIYIVVDDSLSMLSKNRIELSLYALEVFSALIDEKDEVCIYTLKQKPEAPILTIQGNTASRMNEIHQKLSSISVNGTTPYDVVKKAASALLSSPNNAEKWLIILSDGAFSHQKKSVVQNDMNSWNAQNVHTVFLSIDPAPEDELASNGSMGKYFKTDSARILETVSSISNMIFSHLVFPGDRIANVGDTYTLNIDIPIDQLIIFAQGSNVKVASVQLNNAELNNTAYFPVESPDNGAVTLKGVVSRYDQPAGRYYDSGQYQVKISGAQKVEFYYRPAVGLECSLVNSGKVYAGEEQESRVYFTHPGTGEKVVSTLLSGAEIFLTVTNNGNKILDNEKAGPNGEVRKVTLALGTAEVSAYANLPGFITLRKQSQTYDVVEKITPAPPTPTPTVVPTAAPIGGGWEIGQEKLKNNTAITFEATIVDAVSQLPVDQSRWDVTTCQADAAYGIKLAFSKDGMQCPQIRVIPSATGKASDVQTGDLTFTVHTLTNGGNEITGQLFLRVIPFEPIQVQDGSHTFDQISLSSSNTSEYAEISVVDKKTQRALSADVFEKTELKLTSDSGSGLRWDIEKTQKKGVWRLTPKATGKKADITAGLRTLRLEATYDDGTDFTGTKAIKSTGTLNVTINQTPPRALDVTADVPIDPFQRARQNLAAHDPVRVTARYSGADIPQSAWDAAADDSLTLDWDRSKFGLRVEKSADKGVWNVRVEPYAGKGYTTSYGTFTVKAELSFYDPVDEVPYSGTTAFTLTIEPDWVGVVLEFWYDWWWAIVGTIVAAGYIFKKKFAFFALFKIKRLSIVYSRPATVVEPARTAAGDQVKIDFLNYLTFILPFFSQRLEITFSKSFYRCSYGTWKMKAVKRIGGQNLVFMVTNPDEIPVKDIRICGVPYTAESLKENRNFLLDALVIRGRGTGDGTVKIVQH